MTPISPRTLLRCVFLSLLALPVSGCDPLSFFGNKPVKHHHVKAAKPKSTYDASAYTLHLALARITLATTYDAADADPDLDMLQAYAAQKNRKAAPQTIVVMEYKTGGSVKKIIAPIGTGDSFPALLQIINTLGVTSYTPQDIRVLTTTVDPSPGLSFAELTTDQVRATLDQEQQHLLDAARPLAALDDARMQMQLARFFMKHKLRDPAYLAVTNAQQELADASQDKDGDADTLRKLSAELDGIEGQLHKSMPFGL